MKCINKSIAAFVVLLISMLSFTGCATKSVVVDYEKNYYNKNLYEGSLYAENLCVSSQNVEIEGFAGDSTLTSSALFNITDGAVEYASNIHDRIYPASTTKILTALVTLNNCQLTDVVTIGSDAAASAFDAEAQVCGLQTGDQITVEALLNGLLLHSGNDAAVALADYVGGSIENFAAMMNEEASILHASNTHFVTPNGLHDENHYTTAYDLYLIFNECIKNESFLNIIQNSSYTADITGADGSVRQTVWEATSYYVRGLADRPTGATVLGGKTGYTGEAGNCLILLDQDANGKQYISIVMGAESKELLYSDMSDIINQIPNLNMY